MNSVNSDVNSYIEIGGRRKYGGAKTKSKQPSCTYPSTRTFVALLSLTIPFALLACGSIVSSTKSTPQYSLTKQPIKVGDVIFYYLPTGIIKVDGTWEQGKGWTVTVTPDIHPDSEQRYELALNQRYPFFDHTALLTTDNNGLLKTVNATSTDRTVDSAGALIGAAGQALQFAASLGGARALKAEPPPPFHVILNPFDSARRVARPPGFVISVNAPSDMTKARSEDEVYSREERYPGIMTRLPAVFTVTVQASGGQAAETTVSLPDPRQQYLLTVPRGPLVTSETKVEFTNGMMVTRDMKRPSLAYAILGIPKTILSALVPIPGTVETARNTRIQNQINLLKETKELHELQNPSPTPTATATAAATPAEGIN